METVLKGDRYYPELATTPIRKNGFFPNAFGFFKVREQNIRVISTGEDYTKSTVSVFLGDELQPQTFGMISSIVERDESLDISANWHSNEVLLVTTTFGILVGAGPRIIDEVNVKYSEEVQSFLNTHLEVLEKLEKVKGVVGAYFPEEKVQFEVRSDTDEGGREEQTLFLYIITRKNPKEALTILDQVDEEIFDHLDVDPLVLNTNLKFIS